MIAALKFIHIAAILCWCASLIALPLLLAIYGGARRQARFSEFRLITHYGYIGFATPVAIISIVAGTALSFTAEVFDLWFVAKLALVCGMTLVHAWLGHLILVSGERKGTYDMPPPLIALGLGVPLMAAVFVIVLSKPDFGDLTAYMPDFMLAPRGQTP